MKLYTKKELDQLTNEERKELLIKEINELNTEDKNKVIRQMLKVLEL